MEKDKTKFIFCESLDATMDASVVEENNESVNYQTADEENSSKYYSVIEDDSTLENISNSDLSGRIDKETSDSFEIAGESSVDRPFETDLKTLNILDSLSNMDVESVNKFNIHETVETDNVLRPSMDIFDDNESSVDGHELIIDDDPQPDEKSDDCLESGAEASTDMQYVEDTSESIDSSKNLGFGLLKKIHLDVTPDSTLQETKTSCSEENDLDDSPKQIIDVKIFTEDSGDTEMKSESYNFPEGSHRVTLVIDGNNVEAINIGQNIYIYTDSNGELTAFQMIKDNDNPSIKYLHVGKNEDGNIEVYEEQVNQITITPENAEFAKEKELSSSIPNSDTGKIDQKSPAGLEKTSQDLIKAVMNQEKLSLCTNLKNQIFNSENKTPLLSDKEIGSKVDPYKNCKVMLNDKLKSANENDSLTNIGCENNSIESISKRSFEKKIENVDNITTVKDVTVIPKIEIEPLKSDDANSSPSKDSDKSKNVMKIAKNLDSDSGKILKTLLKTSPVVPDEVIDDKKSVLEYKENSVVDSISQEKLACFYSDQSIDYNENEKKTNKTLTDNISHENSSKLDNCKRRESKLEPVDALKIEPVKCEKESLAKTINTMENKSISQSIEKIMTDKEKSRKILGFGKDNSNVTNENTINKCNTSELKVNDVSANLQKSPLENFSNVDSSDKIREKVNTSFTIKTCFPRNKTEESHKTGVDSKNIGVSIEKSSSLPSSETNNDQRFFKLKIFKSDSAQLHITSNSLNLKEEKRDSTNKNEKTSDSTIDNKVKEEVKSNFKDEKGSIETVKEEKPSPYHSTENIKCDDKKVDNDKQKSSPNKERKFEDNLNIVSKTEEKSKDRKDSLTKNDLQINLESDDEFDEEYVEGEPVTGDSGVDWNDGNAQNDASKLNTTVIQVELTEKDNLFNAVENNDNIDVDKLSDDSNNLLIVESTIPSDSVNENIEVQNVSDVTEKILVIDSSESPNILKNSRDENACEKDDSQDIVNAEEIENILNDSCTDMDDEMNEETVTLHIVDSNASSDDMNSMTSPFVTKQVVLDYGKSQEYITKACEPEDLDDSFKGFCHKTSIKTYSREVKPIISSPLKPISNVSIKVTPQISVNSEIKQKDTNSPKISLINKSIDISPKESVGNIAQESSDPKDSPKQKSRQPRKQVFTTVAKSDIEFIFTGSDEVKEQNVAKTAKTYSRSKHKEIGAEKPKPNISNPIKIEDKKVTNAISISDDKIVENVVESSHSENDQKPVSESPEKVPEAIKKDNDEKKTAKENTNAPNGVQEDEKNNSVLNSPLSNSAKRKRGRPKKILSPNSSVFESVILDVDGSLRNPSVKTPVKSKIDAEKHPEVKPNEIVPLKEEIVKESPDKNENKEKIEEKNTNSLEESGKRRKGRPKKILSASFDESSNTAPTSNDLKRKSLPDLDCDAKTHANNDSTNSDNICPICSKSFRSPNVLLKHAKHCNGVINLEAFKSPKRKKIDSKLETVDESKTDDSLISQESQKLADFDSSVNSSKLDDVETDVSAISVCEVTNDTTANEVICEIVSKPEISITEIVEDKPHEDITIDDEKLPEKTDENVTVSETKPISNQSSINTKNTKLDDTKTKGKLPKKVDATSSKLSPMSRLSKFLSAKPPVNKVLKCEICNKTFRQLAHMVYHRNKHDEEKLTNPTPPEKPVRKSIDQQPQKSECDAILKCEICKKGFRKLHHLVEHREMHANSEIKSRRASTVSVKSEPEAGFRCDTCDKSFRKLHHLVAHRDLHLSEGSELNSKPAPEVKTVEKEEEKDGATCSGCGKSFRKRHHMVEHRDTHCSPKKKRLSEDSEFSDNNVRLSITSSTSDETNNCGICGKSYRKLHHMIEHRESHAELVVKSEHRVSTRFSSPDSLNTKDIIHECSKCYMVFPNVNSLNKHIDNCSRKKLLNKKPTSNENSKSNKSAVKSGNVEVNKLSKLPKLEDLPKPSTSKVVKSKFSTQKSDVGNNSLKTITRAKFKSSDNEVKYKINPAFKRKVENASNNVPKLKSKPSESILAHLKVPSARMLKTIIEETTVKYSFPKSPKTVGRPKADSKLPKSTLRKSVATKTNNKPTLSVRRRSLGGRKSLEIKKVIRESEPRQKLQRKTIASIKETAEKNTKKDLCKCDCGKQFENDTLLKKHMDAEHTPPKSYKCHECGVSVRTAVQFSKHKKTHEDAHQNVLNKRSRPSTSSATAAAKNKGVTPRRDVKKLRDAHRGVPLSDKMKKAFAGSKI